ncbi:hypothetical protein F5882DRAFT_435288 [Hyaloscypha sp. PMI_1271]|nr:hypothetical protein F5882DRAFT_435288 [Hyaloscypha sp. PMI_1271]
MCECSVLACVFGSRVESSHRENMLLLDDEVAANDTACTSSTAGVCCQVGAAFIDNGLCFDPFGSAVGGYIRGSCTEKTLASSGCPQYCTYGLSTDSATTGFYNSLSGAGVLSCGNEGFCCESDPPTRCNRQTGDGVFTISGDLKPFATINFFSGTKASSSTKKIAHESPHNHNIQSQQISSTKTSSTSSASLSTTNSSPPAIKGNTALKVGVGVGLPLAAARVGVVGVLAYFLRKRQRQQKGAADPDPSTV